MNKDCIFFEVCQTKENCSVDCIRYAEMKYLIDNSGLPNNLKGRTILQPEKIDYEAFCTLAEIKENIVDFVKQGKNLYIYSHNTGNGKSSWLSKLLKSYFNQIWAGNGFRKRGYFINLPSFLINLKESISNPNEDINDLKEFLKEVDLLCIDDIGATSLSEFEHNYLLYIIEARINNGLSTLYSSNLDGQTLLQYVGTRLKSRIFNNSQIIQLQGKDRRGLKW